MEYRQCTHFPGVNRGIWVKTFAFPFLFAFNSLFRESLPVRRTTRCPGSGQHRECFLSNVDLPHVCIWIHPIGDLETVEFMKMEESLGLTFMDSLMKLPSAIPF